MMNPLSVISRMENVAEGPGGAGNVVILPMESQRTGVVQLYMPITVYVLLMYVAWVPLAPEGPRSTMVPGIAFATGAATVAEMVTAATNRTSLCVLIWCGPPTAAAAWSGRRSNKEFSVGVGGISRKREELATICTLCREFVFGNARARKPGETVGRRQNSAGGRRFSGVTASAQRSVGPAGEVGVERECRVDAQHPVRGEGFRGGGRARLDEDADLETVDVVDEQAVGVLGHAEVIGMDLFPAGGVAADGGVGIVGFGGVGRADDHAQARALPVRLGVQVEDRGPRLVGSVPRRLAGRRPQCRGQAGEMEREPDPFRAADT